MAKTLPGNGEVEYALIPNVCRCIRAFTEHNLAAEFEDNPQDGSRFRNDCFEYGLPYANSPNYSVKLYWWDREKLHRQYIGTIPFKRDQTIQITIKDYIN